MAGEKKKSKCTVAGRKGSKPAQKRYVSERRSETNALKRKKRHERRLAKFAARRKLA